MHDGGVVAVEAYGHGGTGDAPVGQQGSDVWVHETDLAEMADRCRFGF